MILIIQSLTLALDAVLILAVAAAGLLLVDFARKIIHAASIDYIEFYARWQQMVIDGDRQRAMIDFEYLAIERIKANRKLNDG